MVDDDFANGRSDNGMGIVFAVLALIVVACGSLFFIADYLDSRPVRIAAHSPDTSIQPWAR